METDLLVSSFFCSKFLFFISFLKTGAHELALPVFQAMVEISGGYVLPHDTFTTPHLQHNLEFILKETYLSKTKRETFLDSTVIHSIMSPPHRTTTTTDLEGCVVDLRISGYV